MRSAWLATLMLFWVAAVAVRAQSSTAEEPARTRKVTSPSAKESKIRRTVNGTGVKETDAPEFALTVEGTWQKTKEDALDAALKKAQEDLLVYFQSRDLSFLWRPDLDYIRTKLVKGTAEEHKEFDDVNLGLMHRTTVELQGSRKDREYVVRRDRDYRRELQGKQRMEIAEYRMHGLSKVFGAVVALLAGVGGYIRLDELTKGYYTNWLRLAAASLIGAVGAGLWLLV